MDPNIIILAGGISSRMRRPAEQPNAVDVKLLADAEKKSKSMIGVGSGYRPFLDYLLYNVREAGYRDVVIVVGERDRSVREYYGTADRGNEFHGLSITYAVQPVPDGRTKPLGTADAVWHALRVRPDWNAGAVTVCNSDNLYSVAALKAMLAPAAPNALVDYDRRSLEFPASRIEQFAVIARDADGYLADIIEKPDPAVIGSLQDRSGRLGVSMNIFRLRVRDIAPYLERIPLHPQRLEKELPVAVRMMVRDHPRSMLAIPFAEHVPDLTSKDDIPQVQAYLARAFPAFTFDR